MAIVKQYHKDTNTVYVYDSQYYYDKEKKQSRSKRKLIGKIDEETGQIIPTGKRGRKKKTPAADDTPSADAVRADSLELQELRVKAEEQENENILLRIHMESMEKRYRELLAEKDGMVRELQAQVKKLEGAVGRIRPLLKKAVDSLDDAWPAWEGTHHVSDIIKTESSPAEAAFYDEQRGSHQDM